MEGKPLVALVVPVHDNKEDTREFLESLKSVVYPNYKVIVIDDGSRDGTHEMILRDFPDVVLLHGDGNLWWSGATNLGIEKSISLGAQYVLLGGINDCIVDKEFLSALVETSENSLRVITVPKVCYYPEKNRIWQAGGRINWLEGGFKHIGGGEIDHGQYDNQCEVDCATLGMLVDVLSLKNIGCMDACNFPQYWADVDFMCRARKAGYKIVYQPKSLIWHKSSATVKKKENESRVSKAGLLSKLNYLFCSIRSRHNARQVALFYWRHCPKWLIPLNLVYLYVPAIGGLFLRTVYPQYRREQG